MASIKGLITLTVLLASVSAQQLSLIQPISLIKEHFNATKGKLQSTLGYYGHLNYGSERIYKVFIPVRNGSRLDGCAEMKETDFVSAIDQNTRELFKERAAIMVRRGGCSFVQKSINIQKVGAKVAIIIDIVDEDEDNIIMIDSNNEGEMVFIPTYMINHKEGTILWNAI